jgi:hypothetical protein
MRALGVPKQTAIRRFESALLQQRVTANRRSCNIHAMQGWSIRHLRHAGVIAELDILSTFSIRHPTHAGSAGQKYAPSGRSDVLYYLE